MARPPKSQATDTQGVTKDEVQTVTLNNAPPPAPSASRLAAEQTAAIAYNASAGTVDTALEALSPIDTVTVSGNAGGPYTITFTGTHANTNVAQLFGDATYLTSGTVATTITNVYDVASQLTSTGDGSNSNAYTYDNLGPHADRHPSRQQPDTHSRPHQHLQRQQPILRTTTRSTTSRLPRSSSKTCPAGTSSRTSELTSR